MILEPKGISVQSERVFTRCDYLFFIVLTILASGAIVNFMAQWLANSNYSQIVFWGITLIGAGKLASNQLRWWYLPLMKKPIPMAARPGWKVGVATTFVPGEEPIESPLLHLSAAGAAIGSLIVVATERMTFPDPFDPSLLSRDAPSSIKTDELHDVNAQEPAQRAS